MLPRRIQGMNQLEPGLLEPIEHLYWPGPRRPSGQVSDTRFESRALPSLDTWNTHTYRMGNLVTAGSYSLKSPVIHGMRGEFSASRVESRIVPSLDAWDTHSYIIGT